VHAVDYTAKDGWNSFDQMITSKCFCIFWQCSV